MDTALVPSELSSLSSVAVEPSQNCATVGSRGFRHPASAVTPAAARNCNPSAVCGESSDMDAHTGGSHRVDLAPGSPHGGWSFQPRVSPAWSSAPRAAPCSDKPCSPVPSPVALSPLWTLREISGQRVFPSLLSTWCPSILGSGSGDLLGPCSQL